MNKNKIVRKLENDELRMIRGGNLRPVMIVFVPGEAYLHMDNAVENAPDNILFVPLPIRPTF